MFRTFIKVRHTTQDGTCPLLQFPIAVLTGMFQTTLTDVVIDPLGSSAYGIAMFQGHSPIGLPVKCVWQSGQQMLHLSFLRDNLALPICSDSALWQMGIAIDCMVDENITYRHGDVKIIPTASYYDSSTIFGVCAEGLGVSSMNLIEVSTIIMRNTVKARRRTTLCISCEMSSTTS